MKRWTIVSVLLALFIAVLPLDATAAYPNDPYNFGFKKSKNGQPSSINQELFKPALIKHGAIFQGDTTKKELYLTFDNGYENGFTIKVLDVLKEKKVPATFFVTGQYIKDQPELLKRMVQEGHIIGNHSWHHLDFTTVSDERLKNELESVKQEVTKLTGQKEMRYLRPPRGVFSERTLALSRELGYTNVFWSIAYVDWEVNKQKGWPYAYDKVMAQLHPGAILLLHSVSSDNAGALGKIIDDARKQGYEFKSLDQMKAKQP